MLSGLVEYPYLDFTDIITGKLIIITLAMNLKAIFDKVPKTLLYYNMCMWLSEQNTTSDTYSPVITVSNCKF